MAIVTNEFLTYSAIGQREDLEDIIYNIDPTETPFLSMCGRGDAKAVKHEWQMDSLADAAANAQLEGDDVAFPAIAVTSRLHNNAQISYKTLVISGTLEAVDKAGRKSEVAYQLAKRAKELKLDMEYDLTRSSGGLVNGNATTARQYACLPDWIHTNDDRGATGADAAFTGDQIDAAATPTDGTKRAFTETLLKKVCRLCWVAGGKPTIIMLGPINKQTLSSFTGNSTRTDRGEDKRVTAAVDVYVSDFGDHRVVPNRIQREREVFVLTPGMWKVCYLRTFRQFPLAKTGDSEKRMLLVEYSLQSSNEKASGIIADVNDS